MADETGRGYSSDYSGSKPDTGRFRSSCTMRRMDDHATNLYTPISVVLTINIMHTYRTRVARSLDRGLSAQRIIGDSIHFVKTTIAKSKKAMNAGCTHRAFRATPSDRLLRVAQRMPAARCCGCKHAVQQHQRRQLTISMASSPHTCRKTVTSAVRQMRC